VELAAWTIVVNSVARKAITEVRLIPRAKFRPTDETSETGVRPG
jgi:hypothetical protein